MERLCPRAEAREGVLAGIHQLPGQLARPGHSREGHEGGLLHVLPHVLPRFVGAEGHVPVPRERARQSALRQLLHTFFDGSTEQAVAALLDLSSTRLSDAELDRLTRLIADARKEGR